MTEFKAGDWVTVGAIDWFTPGKKYEVFIDGGEELFVLDDDGDAWYAVLSNPILCGTKKTTPPEPPQTIKAHGREYALVPIESPKPHEWKFGQWARHKLHGIVFVYHANQAMVFYAFSGNVRGCAPEELTYICDAEIPS